MRILYVIDSLVSGGAERSLAAVAPHYAARGVELEVAYLHDRPGLQDDFERIGTVLHEIGGENRFTWVRRLAALIAQQRPELVHTTLFESDVAGRVAARRMRVPVVSSLVSEHYGSAHFATPGLRRWKVRGAQFVDAVTARLAVRMHAVSASVAQTMSRNLRYPRDHIDVVPRGRDPSTLGRRTRSRREAARDRLGLTPDVRVLLAVARQEHAKGLDVLLEAMPSVDQRIDRAHLLIAGQSGGASVKLNELVHGLNLSSSVTLLGGRDDVPDLLCAADAFVLPSRREGAPGSVIEAMALELPLVVSDLPQIREIADEGCAVLVPTDSPDQLALAIADVFQDVISATRRVAAARQRFLDHFTIDRVADDMVEFYRRSLAQVAVENRA